MSRPILAGKGHVPRTMYKLTIVALALVCVSEWFRMSTTLYFAVNFPPRYTWTHSIDTAYRVIVSIATFLVSLCLLYWVPASLRRFFPEVNG